MSGTATLAPRIPVIGCNNTDCTRLPVLTQIHTRSTGSSKIHVKSSTHISLIPSISYWDLAFRVGDTSACNAGCKSFVGISELALLHAGGSNPRHSQQERLHPSMGYLR
ncbi:hypothetical protein A0H81_09485 [Grifola frondosa]|uniref:Uncharacterized protein n=1 Tax=Grifola frondosa TaxID=5627 RepID=A0A1C7M3W7_GRIFR|nr:hypothetical protein A0H81_09485 [Grifola frondosa]